MFLKGKTSISASRCKKADLRRVTGRQQVVQVQAFFNFLAPKPAETSSPKTKEIVSSLLQATSSGKGDEVAELVKELQPLGIKAPVRSKLLFGTWDLVYSSKPVASKPRQILEEPNLITEISEFKALGVFAGTTKQTGELGAIDNDNYEVGFDRVETKGGLGGEGRDIDIVFENELLYLDQSIRVVNVKGQDGAPGSLLVYKRVTEDEEEEEEEEEEQQAKKAGTMSFFGGGAPKEGSATIAEREVKKKMAAQQASQGTQKLPLGVKLPGNLPAIPPSPTKVLAKGGAPPSGGADPRAAREKAEAEKKASQAKATELKSAIQDQLKELSEDLKEAQVEARETAAKVKEVERNNAAALKQVSAAKAKLADAAEEVKDVEEDLSKASAARAAAESALKSALAELSSAQGKLKSAGKK